VFAILLNRSIQAVLIGSIMQKGRLIFVNIRKIFNPFAVGAAFCWAFEKIGSAAAQRVYQPLCEVPRVSSPFD
jgi:hypothetical protein